MNTTRTGASLIFLAALVACSRAPRSAAESQTDRKNRIVEELASATQVVEEMDQIPARQRQRARCVVFVPSLVRAAFIVGGRHGDGVVCCRTPSGWSAPGFVRITGGSAGLQVGVESSDLVMLVMSERGISKLFRKSFSLGADASAAAGPVGEAAQAETDSTATAEILSYAHSRGLFAGVELSGAVVKQDWDALTAIYGDAVDVEAILGGNVAMPKEAVVFVERVAAAFPPPRVASANRQTLAGQPVPHLETSEAP
jgi:lipid-binding SYLF domain-containing protein